MYAGPLGDMQMDGSLGDMAGEKFQSRSNSAIQTSNVKNRHFSKLKFLKITGVVMIKGKFAMENQILKSRFCYGIIYDIFCRVFVLSP